MTCGHLRQRLPPIVGLPNCGATGASAVGSRPAPALDTGGFGLLAAEQARRPPGSGHRCRAVREWRRVTLSCGNRAMRAMCALPRPAASAVNARARDSPSTPPHVRQLWGVSRKYPFPMSFRSRTSGVDTDSRSDVDGAPRTGGVSRARGLKWDVRLMIFPADRRHGPVMLSVLSTTRSRERDPRRVLPLQPLDRIQQWRSVDRPRRELCRPVP